MERFFFLSSFLHKRAEEIEDNLEGLEEGRSTNIRRINPGKPRPRIKPLEDVEIEESETISPDLHQTSIGYTPHHIVTAYKLFRVAHRYPGKLFPLFVGANTPIPMGIWVDASAGEQTPGGKVKSKLGPLAYRPGFHAGDVPVATHFGIRGEAKVPTHRNSNYVWAEVSLSDDLDWQSEAASRTRYNKKNQPIPNSADINDQVPFGGHYRYKTNPNMTGDWMISGNMRINRVLTDEEVQQINGAKGVSDLPRRTPLDLAEFGFSPNGKPNR